MDLCFPHGYSLPSRPHSGSSEPHGSLPCCLVPEVQTFEHSLLWLSLCKHTPVKGWSVLAALGKAQLFPSNQGQTPSFWFHYSFKLILQVTGQLSKLSSSSSCSNASPEAESTLKQTACCLHTAESFGEQPMPQKSGSASAPRMKLSTATPASFPLWFVSPSQWALQTTVRCAEQGKGQLALLVTSQGSSKPQFLWCSALLQLTPNCKVAFWSICNSVFWFNFSLKRGLILLRIYLLVLLRTHFISGTSGYVQLPALKPAHQWCFTALHCIPNQEEKQWIYYSKINFHWSLAQDTNFSEMAIIQYSSLDKFSYNITEQGICSFKSSEIQLPQGRQTHPI